MKIYTVGCSFTYGDELADPKNSAWPILLSNKLNASVLNDAVSGGTNYRNVFRTIKNSVNAYDLYIIAWTSYMRFTFYKSDNNFEVNFNPQLTHTLYKNDKSFKNWGNTFYKTWANELFSFKIWLQQIVQLQNFLKDKKFFMVNTMPNNLNSWLSDKNVFINRTKELINFSIMNDDQILDEFKEIQYYNSLIDKDTFFNWGTFNIVDLKNQYPCGPGGHLLEQGHQALADIFFNYVQNKIIVS